MKTRSYITTAIPYVNAAPHIGFALELVQADATARRHRAAHRITRLQTGTDENAYKNVEAASTAGIPNLDWVDSRSAQFRQLADHLQVGHDRFIRTTEAAHIRGVQQFWQALRAGDIFQKGYRGLYCSGCEDFLFPKDLVGGRCPDHQLAPLEVAETNYFFRLSAYQEPLERWLSNEAVTIRPAWRRDEILSFLRTGLPDISISRPAARSAGWGVPVPGDDTQIVYVWIDALINYLTGLGYGTDDTWREWWGDDTQKIHVIGKNVWKFHALYWPALLLSAGLPLPDELAIHGFLTVDGRKIGKSLGNAVSTDDFILRYGSDAVRYFLLRAVPQFGDGDFSADRFAAIYEADLANGLGNLVSRLLTLAHRSGLAAVPERAGIPSKDTAFQPDRAHDEALAAIWAQIDQLNRQLEAAKPWVTLRQGSTVLVREQVAGWLSQLSHLARQIGPYLPATSRQILAHLGADRLQPIAPLFPRKTPPGDPAPGP